MHTREFAIKYSRGQAIAEHLYVWPLLLLLVLGILQFALFYRDKAIVNQATFRAAREGSLNHAFRAPMMTAFVESLAPLYMANNSPIVGNSPSYPDYLAAVGESFVKNLVDPTGTFAVGSLIAGVNIEILSPNEPLFNAFAIDMFALEDDCESKKPTKRRGTTILDSACTETSYFQIPNDNLNIRDTTTQTLNLGTAGAIETNLQDANLLKIRGHWCAALEVPLVGGIIYRVSSALVGNNWGQSWVEFYVATPGFLAHPMAPSCTARNLINQITTRAGFSWGAYFIPITSDAIVRMQTPIRCESNSPNARTNCRNF